jgi:hypothetical protein
VSERCNLPAKSIPDTGVGGGDYRRNEKERLDELAELDKPICPSDCRSPMM